MSVLRCIRVTRTFLVALFLSWPAFAQEPNHYTRFRDAKWYARQLQSLKEEVAKVDADVKAIVEARRSGKGITDAVALDQEPEGATTEGQLAVLRKRRTELMRQIDELEEQARHNEMVPGEIRKEYAPEDPATGRNPARAGKDLEKALAEEKERLERARKDAELLRRDQKLKAEQEYSNPEPSRRNKSELAGIGMRLAEKEAQVQEAEQRLAELEDRLEDLRRNPVKGESEAEESESSPESEQKKDEAYWRKQFADIDYKIMTAKTELDILQRELNFALSQYYPNPATAMKESITRREINEHRKAIEDKKKELTELKKQRDELEDALRHAGGPAGWARE